MAAPWTGVAAVLTNGGQWRVGGPLRPPVGAPELTTPKHPKPAKACMRSPLWSPTCLALCSLLASCGGGGTPSTQPNVPAASGVCDSNPLWAARPANSGSRIPDNSDTGVSVTWDNQNCALQTVTTATLEICLDHPRPADLVWSLTAPSPGAALALTAPADWNASGASCDTEGQGKLQNIVLAPADVAAISPRGDWTLKVKDARLGKEGFLIQWRVKLQGNT